NANGVFNPLYNPNLPGSQPLTVMNQLSGCTNLSSRNCVLQIPVVQNLLQTGQPAQLATLLQVNELQGTLNFFPNPNALAADMLTNYSSSSYNSLQLVARRAFKNGLSFEGNYTYSKVLSDGDGDLQVRFQAFLDFFNPAIERSRANFDLNHVIKGFGRFDLPFGRGHRLRYRPLNRIIGGWTVSPFMTWQSGAPFSILSGRGTLNRTSR